MGEQRPREPDAILRVPDAAVALSTASVYPESAPAAFEMAARLGYDGVEVLVSTDPVSQNVSALAHLAEHYRVPILSIHAPCLLLTRRVWGTEPWAKLEQARAAAETVGAATVVVHPPFRWQREYAQGFGDGLAHLSEEADVVFAVENMFPWRAAGREIAAYAPGWNPVEEDWGDRCPYFTLDLSHTATSRSDALAMAEAMGDRLAHVHVADGSGSPRDEHLVPGRGDQPCAEVLERLARAGFDRTITVEVNTRRAVDRETREADLAEALAFVRLNFAAVAEVG